MIKKEIFLAFLIPSSLAGLLLFFAIIFTPKCEHYLNEGGKSICIDERNNSFIATEEYVMMIFGLAFLSLLLPFYVDWTNRKNRQAKVKPIITK